MYTRSLRWVAALFALIAVALLVSAAQAGTVVVTPTNMDGWAFLTTDNNGIAGGVGGIADMVTGPGTPPLGIGSAQLNPGTFGDQSAQIRNTGYNFTSLSSVTALGYSTYSTQNNGQQFPYIELNIDTTGTGTSADDILFFEPPYQTPATGNATLPNQGNTVMNQWQTWNALEGGWWANNGFGGYGGTNVLPLSDYLVLYPNARIINTASGLGGVRLTYGFASPGDQFNGYVDNVTIGVSGVNTTYDFEPNPPVPEPMSMMLAGLGLSAVAGLRRKARRA